MCIVKGCDRERTARRKFNFWKDAYCSLYCQRFDELKMKKYHPSSDKHTKHFEHWPPIDSHCECCGKTLQLRWSGELANKAFCSQKCNNTNPKRKRAKKHYFALKVMKHNDKLLASQIAKRTEVLQNRVTPTSVANMARIYVKHGLIKRSGDHGKYYYELSDWAKTQPIKSWII